MIYTRGSRFDYDEWERNGCSGWGYNDVLPYFLKSEDIQIPEFMSSIYHSSGGPLAVSSSRTQLTDHFMQAGKEAGYNITDYNGEDQEGFNLVQQTIRHGIRSSTSLEYLGHTANRNNLHIAVRRFVTKIEIINKKATGVFVIRNERKHYIKARKEIILSAGAINSPQILMLSGVGPNNHLSSLGIRVNANLPVGQNLQDHQLAFLFNKINFPYSITESMYESWWTKFRYTVLGTGLLAESSSGGFGFFYSDKAQREKKYTDVQFAFLSVFADSNYFNFKDEVVKEQLAKGPNEHGFTSAVILTHPESKGTITLKSDDPFDYPVLDPQYLTDQRDVKKFIAALRIWEKFIETPTMQGLEAKVEHAKLSICSQHVFRSDAFWECVTRNLAMTASHQCCTCKMGAREDATSVVDPQGRVKGIDSLRVVDASIFPNVTKGNTNAPTIMVAEKISDIIRGIDSVKEIRNKLKVII